MTEGRTMQDGDRRRDLDLLKIDLADPCNVLKSGAPVLMVWRVDKEEDHSLGVGGLGCGGGQQFILSL